MLVSPEHVRPTQRNLEDRALLMLQSPPPMELQLQCCSTVVISASSQLCTHRNLHCCLSSPPKPANVQQWPAPHTTLHLAQPSRHTWCFLGCLLNGSCHAHLRPTSTIQHAWLLDLLRQTPMDSESAAAQARHLLRLNALNPPPHSHSCIALFCCLAPEPLAQQQQQRQLRSS